MVGLTKTTFSPKAADVKRNWYVIDAKGLTLGRVATEIAGRLRGKHKPTWAPHLDSGDHVVVFNAEALDISLKKKDQKIYWHHTGYPGGIKQTSMANLLQNKPERVVRSAVRGMLPKGRLGRKQLKRLRVYEGSFHPHGAQMPETIEVESRRS